MNKQELLEKYKCKSLEDFKALLIDITKQHQDMWVDFLSVMNEILSASGRGDE